MKSQMYSDDLYQTCTIANSAHTPPPPPPPHLHPPLTFKFCLCICREWIFFTTASRIASVLSELPTVCADSMAVTGDGRRGGEGMGGEGGRGGDGRGGGGGEGRGGGGGNN